MGSLVEALSVFFAVTDDSVLSELFKICPFKVILLLPLFWARCSCEHQRNRERNHNRRRLALDVADHFWPPPCHTDLLPLHGQLTLERDLLLVPAETPHPKDLCAPWLWCRFLMSRLNSGIFICPPGCVDVMDGGKMPLWM